MDKVLLLLLFFLIILFLLLVEVVVLVLYNAIFTQEWTYTCVIILFTLLNTHTHGKGTGWAGCVGRMTGSQVTLFAPVEKETTISTHPL